MNLFGGLCKRFEWSWSYKGHWTSETSYADQVLQTVGKDVDGIAYIRKTGAYCKATRVVSAEAIVIPMMTTNGKEETV